MTRLVLFAAAFAVLAGNFAIAGPRENVRANSARCDGIADDHTWLDCYYGAAQPMRAQLGLSPAPAAQVRLSIPAPGMAVAPPLSAGPAPPPMPKPGGFLNNVLRDSPDPGIYRMAMTAYWFNDSHHFTTTLANGEIWVQGEDDVHLARWKGPPGKYAVTIQPGLLGNYVMRVSNVSGDFKVKRVR